MERASPPPDAQRGYGTRDEQLARLSDDLLVKLIAEGSESAFRIFYDRHCRRVLSLCRWMLRDREDAEDARQETFTSVHAHLRCGDRPVHTRAWLHTVARNCCLATLRKPHFDWQPLDERSGPDCAEVLDLQLSVEALVEEINRLPGDERTALTLLELAGLSHADIADILGCQPARVKAIVFKARSRLRRDRAGFSA